MNQHVKTSEYCEIIEGAVKEKIKSSEKAHRVKPCKVGPGCLVFLKVNSVGELEKIPARVCPKIGNQERS